MTDAPYSHPSISPDQFEEHVGNFTSSVGNASPQERRQGRRWYDVGHRDAVHNSLDIAPGVKLNHPSGNGTQSSPAGLRERVAWRKANPGTDMAEHIRGKRDPDATYRAAGEIAATSPASPSGMDWEKNSQAAFEASRMSPGQHELLKESLTQMHSEQLARGAVKKAVNRGQPTKKLQKQADEAKAVSRNTSTIAREPLKGKASAFAGNQALAGARDIHTGEKTPEQVLSPLKTGHFAKSLADPYGSGASGITVDEHMQNILGGRTKWGIHRPDAPARPSERSIPDVTKPAGYQYSKDVISEGAKRIGMRPNVAQAIAWIHEKNDKNMSEGGGVSAQEKARSTINTNVSNRLMGVQGL